MTMQHPNDDDDDDDNDDDDVYFINLVTTQFYKSIRWIFNQIKSDLQRVLFKYEHFSRF